MEISRFSYNFLLSSQESNLHIEQALAKIKDSAVSRIYNPFTDSLFLKVETDSICDKYWCLQERNALTSEHALIKFCKAGTRVPIMLSFFDVYGKYITVLINKFNKIADNGRAESLTKLLVSVHIKSKCLSIFDGDGPCLREAKALLF